MITCKQIAGLTPEETATAQSNPDIWPLALMLRYQAWDTELKELVREMIIGRGHIPEIVSGI